MKSPGSTAAVRYAADKARPGPYYRLVEYPRQKELFEAIQNFIEKITPTNAPATGLAAKMV